MEELMNMWKAEWNDPQLMAAAIIAYRRPNLDDNSMEAVYFVGDGIVFPLTLTATGVKFMDQLATIADDDSIEFFTTKDFPSFERSDVAREIQFFINHGLVEVYEGILDQFSWI